MAFAFALPAIGSAVLPAIGAIGSGLGAAASGIGGALASGAGALGGAIGSLPGLSSVGGAIGSLGSGLGGGLAALGGGNLGGALSSVGSGLLGAGSNALSGLGGLYTGADKILGGLLPNIGGAGITPQNGYLGALFKPQAAGPNAVGYGTVLAPPPGGFPAEGLAPGHMGGFFGMGGGLDGFVGKAAGLAKIAQGLGLGGEGGQPGVTQGQVNARPIVPGQVQEAPKPIILGGGQSPGNQALQLGPPTGFYNSGGVSPMGIQYQDRVSELVRDTLKDMNMGGTGGGGMTPQARSLANTMGARATSMYS